MASFSDIAKAIIKIGAKAAVPVLGDVVTTGLEQVGGLLAEDYGVRRAKQFQDRLIAEIQSHLERVCRSEGVSEDQLTAVLATAQDALARYALSIPEWTAKMRRRRCYRGLARSFPGLMMVRGLSFATSLRPSTVGFSGTGICYWTRRQIFATLSCTASIAFSPLRRGPPTNGKR